MKRVCLCVASMGIILLLNSFFSLYINKRTPPLFGKSIRQSSTLFQFSSLFFSFVFGSFGTFMAANWKSGGGIVSLGKRLLNKTSTRHPTLFNATFSPYPSPPASTIRFFPCLPLIFFHFLCTFFFGLFC